MQDDKTRKKQDIRSAIIGGMAYSERKEIEDQCEELARESGFNLVMIGTGDERNALAASIVGYDNKTHALIYDYDLMVKCFSDWDGMSEDEAIEWVEYNTIGCLPEDTETTKRPIVMNRMEA